MMTDLIIEQEDAIKIFRFCRSTDTAVNAWADAIEATIQQTPKDQPFYILLDVSGENVEFTSTARQHSKRIFTQYQQRLGYIAMLFEWRTSHNFARLFFAYIGKRGFKLTYCSERLKV